MVGINVIYRSKWVLWTDGADTEARKVGDKRVLLRELQRSYPR